MRTKVIVYLNSQAKFILNNCQMLKALKFNRQPSKLEKIAVNSQSNHRTETSEIAEELLTWKGSVPSV